MSIVHHTHLGTLLKEVWTFDCKDKALNFGYLVDCVRLSVADQYPSRVAEIYPGELRKIRPPHSSLAELHGAFEKAVPFLIQAWHDPKRSLDPASSKTPRILAPTRVAIIIDGYRVTIPAR